VLGLAGRWAASWECATCSKAVSENRTRSSPDNYDLVADLAINASIALPHCLLN
jgi:hypothetical protein